MTDLLTLQRRQTRWFIDEAPVKLTLTPRVKVSNHSGGWRWLEGDPKDPQRFTLIAQDVTDAALIPPALMSQASGENQVAEYVLVGMHDANISIGDFWSDDEARYEVVYVFPRNGYEVRAGVVRDAI